MSELTPQITTIGLGTGSPDSISLGAFKKLLEFQKSGAPVYARTSRHPTVDWLRTEHGFEFTGAFDDLYDRHESFEDVYAAIFQDLLDSAKSNGHIGYAVPGHPSFGEAVVGMLQEASDKGELRLETIGSLSYVDSVLQCSRAKPSKSGLRILDALEMFAPVDPYSAEIEPFDPESTHVVCQVYDRAIASDLKLALLEFYPPHAQICIITAAGMDAESRTVRSLSELDHSGAVFDHLTSVVVYPLDKPEDYNGYRGMLTIMAKLRNPQGGCPWDLEQTPQSLRRYLLEEAYELVDVLDANPEANTHDYAEELGDVLLQVVFHAQIAREKGEFAMRDIIRALSEKLLRRHPHVFGEVDAKTADKVIENWNAIKKTEKSGDARKSILDGIPRSMPSLMRAQEISKRAAKAGFEWDSIDGVFEKLSEEVGELQEAIGKGDEEAVECELGDLLFTVVNLARFRKVDSETALSKMLVRFCSRFAHIEEHATSQGKHLEELSLSEMEHVWQLAKSKRFYDADPLEPGYT